MRKDSITDLWLGSKYTSEGFLISVWFQLFHHTLSKNPLEVDLKWNLSWNCLLLRILSDGQKLFCIKKEKNYLSDLSHNVWKSFSANANNTQRQQILLLFLLYYRLKASCSDVCFSVASSVRLASVSEELFIWETGRDKKSGVDDKREKKTTSFLCGAVVGTCYCK